MIKKVKTNIKDLVLIKTRIFRDNRGFFKKLKKVKFLKKNLFLIVFRFQKKILYEDCICKRKKAKQKL